MKKILFSLLIAFAYTTASYAGVIVLDGNYQGKNLFVQNPFAQSGVGFCTYEVTVNGEVTTDEINSSAFEIDLSFFQLELGTPVEIKIKHKDDCKPKVINPEVLKPMSTFEIGAMTVTDQGELFWTTTNETGKLPYIIEQFRWNKWVEIGEVEGKGSPEENKYTFPIATIHSGENRFRLKQVDATGKPRYSFDVKYRSPLDPVKFADPGDGKRAKDYIAFSGKTMYEIFNEYGVIVDQGIADRVDVSNLEDGTYYVNFDNTFATFKK